MDAGGNVYVADSSNHRIRKFTATTSTWSTIGGDGTAGHVEGIAGAARFNVPFGVAVGANGNLYVADFSSFYVRMFTASTSLWSTIGGTGATGYADGAVGVSQFASPMKVAVDADDNVYVADGSGNRIRMFDASTSTWSTIGGDGTSSAPTFVDGPIIGFRQQPHPQVHCGHLHVVDHRRRWQCSVCRWQRSQQRVLWAAWLVLGR